MNVLIGILIILGIITIIVIILIYKKIIEKIIAFIVMIGVMAAVAMLPYFAYKHLSNMSLSNAFNSKSWPTTKGIVVSIKHRFSGDGFSGSHQIDIEYKYNVKSQIYKSSNFAFLQDENFSQEETGKIINQIKNCKTIKVYYKPSNPDISVLQPGMNSTLFALGLGGFLFFMGLSAIGLILNSESNINLSKSIKTNIQ